VPVNEWENSSEPFTIQIPSDRKKAWSILHRLATDEEYYRKVKKHPELIFGTEEGIGLPPALVPPEQTPIDLPPRWQIQDLLDRADDPFAEGAKPPIGFAVFMMSIAWGGPTPPEPPDECDEPDD
jgi:hypothetical protein